MQFFRKQIIATLSAVLLALATVMPATVYAAEIEETPSAGAMVGDLLIARPLLLVTTVAGTAVYLVSLPFTLLGGNAGEAAEVLVLDPAAATFTRCLGCENTNRDTSDVDDSDYQASNSGGYDLSDAVVSDEEIYPVYGQKQPSKFTPYIKAGYHSAKLVDEFESDGYGVTIGSSVLKTSKGFVEAEISYIDYGDAEINAGGGGDPDDLYTYNVTSVSAGLNAGVIVGSRGYVYAKGGFSSWELETINEDKDPDDPFVSKTKVDDSDYYYGAGVGVDITKNLNLNVEYLVQNMSKIEADESNITSMSANLAVKF